MAPRRQSVNTYVDSSVILRFIFAEPRPLAEWSLITRGVSSSLLHVECRRAIDRERHVTRDAKAVARYRNLLLNLVENLEILSVTDDVVAVASQALPFVIRSLDAIHLATAIDWRRRNDQAALSSGQ
ncbi:MAG TPA: PIN domain-containing protein [Thermoanaerobaculia bacterium]|jgi:predicted nucleic acid-binding protein